MSMSISACRPSARDFRPICHDQRRSSSLLSLSFFHSLCLSSALRGLSYSTWACPTHARDVQRHVVIDGCPLLSLLSASLSTATVNSLFFTRFDAVDRFLFGLTAREPEIFRHVMIANSFLFLPPAILRTSSSIRLAPRLLPPTPFLRPALRRLPNS